MRWITYYEDVRINGVIDVVVHKDKETATKYFVRHYRDYFEINPKYIQVELPARYGFPFRAYHGVSLKTFKNRMIKQFNITEEEFYEELETCQGGKNARK